ncbi:MAG: hypothetical protein HQL17_03125 [Candidatus Omnitrophica bacterium]|nr:hypothetical protein [Candidatus Omnitrophota bacterium]
MAENKNPNEKKGFFARLFESLDKKMETKAKDSCGCCCGPKSKDDKKSSCC